MLRRSVGECRVPVEAAAVFVLSHVKAWHAPPQLGLLVATSLARQAHAALSFSASSMDFADAEFSKSSVVRQVWRSQNPGKISDLRLVTEELHPPPHGEIRVVIKAIGLNFADVATCLGLYSAAPKGVYTPGLEFAGIVDAVGEGVDALSVGDRVLGLTRFGAYSSHINIPSKYVRSFPENWSFSEAASFPVQGLTMVYALRELGNVQRGQTVLVHSAAGGCGTFALGICKSLKVHVVATVGSDDKVKHLLEYWGEDFLPPERIIVRGVGAPFKQQLEASLASLRVEGFDCILDAVLGDYFLPAYDKLSRGGRYIVYGASSMMPHGNRPNWLTLAWKYFRRPILDPLKMMGENKNIMQQPIGCLYASQPQCFLCRLREQYTLIL
ncbi:hypothetical protein O6H91_21G049500 [Diphasiastrum complanatum]|uniref:Uncharacterized protein n=1 Tax=Diphasiastrum complanatum TaxID=34168 RepID=A0ACC2AKB7_DIPCM|nr:hypothetical protein O6H91_21G049500 [Diphasiastrum complanatum]